jgi:hypothetical protein
MSESQEQPKDPIAPKKAKKAERREEAAIPAEEAPKHETITPVEVGNAAEKVAAPEPSAAPVPQRGIRPYFAQAAAVLIALGLGWAGGHATTAANRSAADPASAAILAIDWSGLASGLQKVEGDTIRMAADVQALKGALAGLKDVADRSKQDAAARFGQLAERLDRIQKVEQESAAKLASLPERIEKAEREATARLTSILERLDRMERPMTGQAPAAKPPVQAAAQAAAAQVATTADTSPRTGGIPDQQAEGGKSEQPKTDPKAMPIEGWVLREVYDGVALIEGRNKRLLEIAPGQSLSGIGRVESIERRGRSWVVVTTRGVITSQPW